MGKYLNIEECRKILQKLKDSGFTIIRCRDWNQYKDKTEGKICILRHDLDQNIDWGLELARLESSMGIHSSFFVLNTRPYYRQPDFISKCREIQEMGHEVGLHYDVLSVCLKDLTFTPKMVLDMELRFLRDGGIEVHSLSAHGETSPQISGVIGYQIFKEFYKPNAPMKYRHIELYALSLTEYGLNEAYWFLRLKPFDYLTDCAGRKHEHLISQIEEAAKSNNVFCELLLHPCNHLGDCDYPDFKGKQKVGKQCPHP